MKPEEIVDFYAHFAGSYDQMVLEEGDYVAFKTLPRWIIGKLGKRATRLLDLGCGTGLSSLEFFKMGYEVTGTDITPEMLQKAQKHPFAELLCLNLDQPLPFADGLFDAATLLGVMEFIKRPAALFSEIARVLKKGGLLAVTIPQKLPDQIEKKLEIGTFETKEIEELFDRCGFEILKKETLPGFLSCGESVHYTGYLVSALCSLSSEKSRLSERTATSHTKTTSTTIGPIR
jgi:ubiquinone/menaquinone biosynthesis C-methylase UbiE